MAIGNPHFVERASCPCCGGPSHDVLYACPFEEDPIRAYLQSFYAPPSGVEFEYLRGARYELRRCHACTFIYQSQVGDEFLLGKLYGQWISPSAAKQYDDHRRDLRFHLGYAKEVVAVLAHLGKPPADTRLLDFGMGWGKWCLMGKGLGCQVFGTELSRERIAFARSQGISVIASDEIPGGEFDFINTEQVFEHLVEPLATLRHLVRGLAPDGLIKISVPNGKRIPGRLENPDWTAPRGSRRSLNPVAPLEHVNCFNHRSLVELARRAKLMPVQLDAEVFVDVVPAQSWLTCSRARLNRLGGAIGGLIPPRWRHRRKTSLFFRRES